MLVPVVRQSDVSSRSHQPIHPKALRGNNSSKATLTGNAKFRAASLNVGTLNKKSAEVVETLTRRKIDLCSLQEIRKKGALQPGQVEWITGKDSRMRLYWCGNQKRPPSGGVGIMLAEKWVEKVFEVKRITDRILMLKLIIGKQIYTFVALYAPQVGLPAAEKDSFYYQLQSAVMGISDSEKVFFLGDWNGHVGAAADGFEIVHGGHGFGNRNSEGERILDFAIANDLIVGNTLFTKRDSHLITYSSGETRTQVDYVLYCKNFRGKVTNVKVIPGEEVASQHFLLVCDFTVSIPPQKKRKFVPRLRTWKLRDPAVISRYHDVFKTKAANVVSSQVDNPVETSWSNFKTPLLEATKETCGLSKAHRWKKETWWWNEQVDSAIESKRAQFSTYMSLREQGDPGVVKAKADYDIAKRNTRREIWLARSAASVETFKAVDSQGSNIYRIARQMSRENQDIVGESCVRNDDGQLSLTDEDQMKAWFQHYKRLLNDTFPWPRDKLPDIPPVAGPPPSPTHDKIRKAVSKMKCGKAAGPSGIIPEMIKASGEEGVSLLRQLCEDVFSTGQIPEEWEESIILNLYKGKGDALDRGNYRGLKLTEQVMKVLEGVLESAVREMVDMNKLQFGFVPGRGTTDAIFITRQLQEKYRAAKKPLYFAFVDLEKAFDRVPREVIWWALRSLGVEEWAVRVIQGMYANARSRVRVNGQLSEDFNVTVGVHQGSVLSPLLFILVLEALSKNFHSDEQCSVITLLELLYADDLVIIASSEEELVKRLKGWKARLEAKGFRMSMPKTKVMVSGEGLDVLIDQGTYPCAVCRKGVGGGSIICTSCHHWVHGKCSLVEGRLKEDPNYVCPRCRGLSRPIDGRPAPTIKVEVTDEKTGEVTEVFDVDVVAEFRYLGDMLEAGGGCKRAITNRCGVAWSKFRELRPVLTSRHIPFHIRGSVYSTCVRAAMLHGSETWAPNADDLQRLRRNDRAMIRWICGVKPQDRIRSDDLLIKLRLADIEKVLMSNRLRWYGHAKRSQDYINTIMDVEVEKGKRKGNRKTWKQCVDNDMKVCKLKDADTLDRVKWRGAVKECRLLPTPDSGN